MNQINWHTVIKMILVTVTIDLFDTNEKVNGLQIEWNFLEVY